MTIEFPAMTNDDAATVGLLLGGILHMTDLGDIKRRLILNYGFTAHLAVEYLGKGNPVSRVYLYRGDTDGKTYGHWLCKIML